ncbi:MAG: hypothetical protein WCG01_02945 [bacterium]
MSKISKLNNSAFTMIELAIGIFVSIILASIGYAFIFNSIKSTTFEAEQATAITSARQGVDIMAKELRGINVKMGSPTGAIESFSDDEIIFYSDINDDEKTEKIRYFMSATTTLSKIVWAPGPNKDYNTIPSATTTVSKYINNLTEPIFEYYGNDTLNTVVTDITQISLIKITLKINVTPWRAPGDFYLTSAVKLRNRN